MFFSLFKKRIIATHSQLSTTIIKVDDMGLQHSVPKRHHKNKRKNIMNIQEEKRVCFDVDQNKQKINFLLKKNKENETQQTELNQKLATAQSDINSLSSAVETLQNSTPTEEKIELLSYDIYRNRDIMYRNNLWEPSAIFFLCDVGAKFKLHIWFTIVGTYPENSGDATVTTTIELDGEQIYSKEYAFSGPFSDDIEYTGFFTSKKKSHKLVIKSSNTKEPKKISYYTRSNMLNIELWGTNVMFLTRKYDFHISPSDTQNLMTTTCIDDKPRLSLQNADENLSMDSSNFRTLKTISSTPDLNQIKAFMFYYMGENGPIYTTMPSLYLRFYPYINTYRRAGFIFNLSDSENTENYPPYYMGGCDYFSPALTNKTTSSPYQMCAFSNFGKNIYYTPNRETFLLQYKTPETHEIIDINGTVRLGDNSCLTPIVCIVTRDDGSNYLFEGSLVAEKDPPKLELGFGTNVNAYSTPDGFLIYMRVGKNTKKLLVTKNSTSNSFEIISTQMLDNIQEFWHGANGTHYERVGDKILYYPANSTSPTAALYLDI